MTNTYTHPDLQTRAALAPWARVAAIVAGVGLAAAAVVQAVRLGQPLLLLGLLPAAAVAAGLLLLGLRPWPLWSKLTGAILLLGSSSWFLCAGLWQLGGHHPWINSDVAAAAGAILGGCAFLALLLWAGGWVYRDARRRGLNAGAWALVAVVIFPYLIGLIAYLVVVVLRDQQAVVCATCGARLPGNAAFCIRCGHPARAACPACQAPLVAGAAFCAHCGAAQPAAPGERAQ